LLKFAAALPLMSGWPRISAATPVALMALSTTPPLSRVRPSDPDWPTDAQWVTLRQQLGEALVAVRSPWADCRAQSDSAACAQLFKFPQNPYTIGDDFALTQTYGWVDAWTSSFRTRATGRSRPVDRER
jgi:hypothetical protein